MVGEKGTRSMPQSERTSISVVSGTYNRLEHLKRMINSVCKSVGDLSYEIIIVDGGSDDGTIEWCEDRNDVRLIRQGKLLGAINAFNEGCRYAVGKYVAILNDDIEVVGDTLQIAYTYLEKHPEVGQVAFRNNIKGTADRHRRELGHAAGYVYGQCCMTPRHLGDWAGWWGDEGMWTYGGDTRLSLRLVEMGYLTVPVEGCEIVDWVADDDLRKFNNEDMRGPNNKHPDTQKFKEHWRGRIPEPDKHVSASVRGLMDRAGNGVLRTLRFKGMMNPRHQPRTTLIDTFAQYGPTRQINRSAIVNDDGLEAYQDFVLDTIAEWKPDLVLFQAQRRNAVLPETVHELRNKHPNVVFVNWDGDSHPRMGQFYADIAESVHLQLVVSPDYFRWYDEYAPKSNVGYWPIGIEQEYIDQERLEPDGPDVLFLGSLFGEGVFPEALIRRDAVVALTKMRDIDFVLYGAGWNKVGINAPYSGEKHADNAKLYARSKMALSISQLKDAWGYTSDRLYNIAATGCPALVQKFSGMEEHGFVDGWSCIAWETIDEMKEKIRHYLKYEDEREIIGRRGMEVTLDRHTWEARMSGFWEMVSVIRGLQ